MQIKETYHNILKRGYTYFSSLPVQGLCLIVYKVFVDLIYLLYIGKRYTYGIKINVLNVLSSYLYIGLYIVCIYYLVKTITASSMLLIILNMIYFIPLTTYCSLGTGSSSLLLYAMIYWTFLSGLQIITPVFVIKKTEVSDYLRSLLLYALLIGVSIFTIYLSWKYTDFRIITNIFDVYGIRSEAAAYDMASWQRYLQGFSTIIIPLLILASFKERKYLLVIWEMFLLILNFSFAGHKSVLFMGILVVIGAAFWKKEMVSFILPGGICLAIASIVEEKISSHSYIIDYYFRRIGYLPAQLSDEYYRFFQNNPLDIFRSTFLGKIGFSSPYNLSIPYVIGNNYLSQIVSNNNGLLADVWSNLGIIGIFIMPFILIACFRLFDMATNRIDSKYLIGLIIYYAVIFADTTWSTVLLTHGFLIMCIGYFVFPRK